MQLQRQTRTWHLQILLWHSAVVGMFSLVYLITLFFFKNLSEILVSSVVTSVYFLLLRVFLHKFTLIVVIFSTVFFSVCIDFLLPLILGDFILISNILRQFWMVIFLIFLEIYLEEFLNKIPADQK